MKTNWKIFTLILSLTAILVIPACKKDNQGGTSAPTVTRVRLLSKLDTVRDVIHRINLDSINVYDQSRLRAIDSTVTAGRLNTQYGIIGTNLLTTKSMSFNGVSIYFNPGLVTDNSIIFTIPVNIPYGPTQSNQLVIVTQYGTVTYSFIILQPPPVITSFTPLSGAAGAIVTITGTALDNATIVRFDSNPGQIIGTPTATEIKVKVPAGVVKANIFVTTPGGTVKSADSFGIPAPVFKALVYDEKFATNWTFGGYGTTRDAVNAEHPKRGLYAIKTIANDATNIYGGFTVGYKDAVGNGLDVIKLGITSIKFSVYGDLNTDTKTIQMYVNSNYSVAVQVKIVGGVYTDITIPLSSFNNPAVITEIAIQNVSGSVPLTWYIDDIGFM